MKKCTKKLKIYFDISLRSTAPKSNQTVMKNGKKTNQYSKNYNETNRKSKIPLNNNILPAIIHVLLSTNEDNYPEMSSVFTDSLVNPNTTQSPPQPS